MTTPEDDARSIELEVEVPGTPEQVWQAIATGPGISAWMHPTEVEEREGGHFSFDMGSGMTGAGVVAGWDPPRRFVEETEWSPQGDAPPARVATEWLVEAREGGTCLVRMVMSGFGSEAAWDEEIEGMGEGMQLGLENLRRYLTLFAGQDGTWMRAFGHAPGSRTEGFAALTAALGLAGASEGARVATAGDGVPRLAGVVDQAFEAKWHSALLLVIEQPAPGIANVIVYGENLWTTVQACLYGDEGAAIAARERDRWREWMQAHFPA